MIDSWADIAFAYDGALPSLTEDASIPDPPGLICAQNLDEPLSTLPSESELSPPPIVRLHVDRHADCSLGSVEPLAAHLRAGCAKHIPYPSLRRDDRYFPPNRPSKDVNITRLPYRKTTRSSRGSRSPPKRSVSGSVSLSKDNTHDIGGDDDVTDLVAPPTADIPVERARQTMAGFRTSCLAASSKCAVTGKGRSWYMNPNVGPAVQACHIVPQQHYHVYPVPRAFTTDSRYSPRRLREAWDRTWSAKNGLLLFSHLHELFDARLFSIHPETLRICVFVPYNVILEYHGSVAQLSPVVDRRALHHHYDMCCIENMAAEMPLSEQPLVSEADATSPASGTRSPPTTGGSSAPSSHRCETSPPDQEDEALRERERDVCLLNKAGESNRTKRRRIAASGDSVLVHNSSEPDDAFHDPHWEGSITPWNSRAFLADANWELGRVHNP